MADIQPDKKTRASGTNRVDTVYTGIVEAMSNGDFPENARLPTEAELALQYGVSRPTVREALSRLRLDGLIASKRGSGSYVLRRPDRNIKRFAPIESIADVQRCFAFRIALEASGASLSAEMRTPRDLDDIRRCFDAMEAARNQDDNIAFVEHDLQFHLAVARGSQNVFFVTALELIIEQMRVGMQLALNLSLERERVWRELVQIEHREILTAIEKGSSVDAAEAMRFHLGNARRRLFEGPAQKTSG
ncbi:MULTISPECIES: FadR/GntR family transcriptional regulator [unclassified Uliginosibacterium]|uniref:FadR/GntR family transcriptional regulator n=1 Tax=unclassified Uliginosibacterium TaxID=2621521 RepID=UPI001304475D|nr:MULTISPECIES: FadR/GntR family transcriptional regulator [unclassified Uliginosibacterium]MDO6388373.1 FadR/GntR family transcriptional regulator [Uliginosibacterium sp. 31-12]